MMTTIDSLTSLTIEGNTPPFDTDKSADFAENLLNILNSGALAHMLSIGHRTGLLDTLAELPPATSQQIADAAKLTERYVREWLGAMVTGHIVIYYSGNKTYRLPAEHAAWLTRSASPNNMATTMQFIPLIGGVEDAIVDCFHQGGGVPYAAYQRFHTVMAEESAQTVITALETQILPLVLGLKEQLAEGISVVDIGCGQGRILHTLASWFPNSRFVGYDLSSDVITWAKAESQRLGLQNVTFQVQDAALIVEENQYDLALSFDAIHDQAQPGIVLQNIYRALRPEGLYLMQEIQASSNLEDNLNHPVGPLLYSISCNHCTAVSLAAGGPGLGAMWGQELALEMLQAAGFSNIEVQQLENDFQNTYYLARRLSQ
ncbi:class I SAM-dependent methyltransferase [Leptothoe sp. EHU-05/26/07-4]